MKISDNQYLEKVFTNVRQKLNRSENEQIFDHKGIFIWGLSISTTMRAAVHLGQHQNENLVTHKNTNSQELKALFDITLKLILDQNFEILNVSTIGWTFSMVRSTLLHDKVTKGRTQVHVYSDSVLCLGRMHGHPESEGYRELFGIDGEQFEFHGHFSQDIQHWRFSKRFRTKWQLLKQVQNNLKIGSSSCLCSTTLTGQRKGYSTECSSNSEKVQNYERKLQLRHWSFLGPGEIEKRYGTHSYKPEGQWNTTADVMVDDFKHYGHPVLRASSALDRGFLRKKGGRCTIHFRAEPFERRAFISHNSFCKSAQYLRSSSEVV